MKTCGVCVKEWSQEHLPWQACYWAAARIQRAGSRNLSKKWTHRKLMGLNKKGCAVAEHTGIAEPSWYPRGHIMAQKGFSFPILFWKISPCSIASIYAPPGLWFTSRKQNLICLQTVIFFLMVVFCLQDLFFPSMCLKWHRSVKKQDLN